MFENIGWAKIFVIVVAALFILGPERLPEAARWLGKAITQVRDYATGAREHLQREFGPELRTLQNDLQQPLAELRRLRNVDPRTALTRTLFPEDEASTPNRYPYRYGRTDGPAAAESPSTARAPHPRTAAAPAAPVVESGWRAGEAPSPPPAIDPDAT